MSSDNFLTLFLPISSEFSFDKIELKESTISPLTNISSFTKLPFSKSRIL